jgi:hypothetical protein
MRKVPQISCVLHRMSLDIHITTMHPSIFKSINHVINQVVNTFMHLHELNQGVREQFFDILSRGRMLLIHNPFSGLLGFHFVGQILDRADLTLAREIKQTVELLLIAPPTSSDPGSIAASATTRTWWHAETTDAFPDGPCHGLMIEVLGSGISEVCVDL